MTGMNVAHDEENHNERLSKQGDTETRLGRTDCIVDQQLGEGPDLEEVN